MLGIDVGSRVGFVGTVVGNGEGAAVIVGTGVVEGSSEGIGDGEHVCVPGSVSQHGVPKSLPVVTCQPAMTPLERAWTSEGTSEQSCGRTWRMEGGYGVVEPC